MATITSTTDTQSRAITPLLSRAYVVNWEVITYLVIFGLAVFTRFYHLGDRVMSHDESLHTRYSYNLYANGDYQHTPLMHGPILFHFVALSYFLFGDNDFTARIYPAVLGIMLVMFPLLFRRWLGRWGAILASLMILISPLLMYYNRYIREDTPSIFYSLIMFYSIMMYLDGPVGRRGKTYWLVILSAAMLGSLGSKEVAFFYIGIFGSFVGLYWLVRLSQDFLKVPGKSLFYILMIAILLGGVAALGMYVVLDIIPPATASTAAQTGGWFGNVTSRGFIIATLGVVVTTVAALVGTLLWAFVDRLQNINWSEVAVIVAIGLVACLGMIVMEEASHVQPNAATTAQPSVPGQPAENVQSASTMRWWPMLIDWALVAVGVGILLYSQSAGWWEVLRRYPELDVLIILGTLFLPWLAALFPYLMRGSPNDYVEIGQNLPKFLSDILPVKTSQEIGQVMVGFFAWLPLAILAITAGLVWDWKRWIVCAAVFHILFAFFFTTMFTNIPGLATGMYYSLGYWLEQQGVRRGSQPQYYYLLVIMPVYEFLPVIGSILAMISGLTIFWRFRRKRIEQYEEARSISFEAPKHDDAAATIGQSEEETPSLEAVLGGNAPSRIATFTGNLPLSLDRLPFLLFVSWWAILNLVFYTLAGEKMPWLGTHLTLPLIFLSAWYFGGVFGKIDLPKFLERGWVYLFLLPLFILAAFQIVFPVISGQSPFAGLQQQQLVHTYSWLAYVAIAGAVIFAVFWLAERTGWQHFRVMLGAGTFIVLALLTFRVAWMASMINYDYATEFLVYAHSAPAVKTVLNQLEDLSRRTTDGMGLRFAYDDKVSWPYSWYFRHFTNAVYFGSNPTNQSLKDAVVVIVGDENRPKVEPLLEDRYVRYDYIRLWWPMQDYFGLTAERIANVLDFSPEDQQAAQIRQGIFDMWWARDYTAYGQAIQKNFNVSQWPVADKMHVYVLKDVAAQVWSYGTGEGKVSASTTVTQPNLCNANWVQSPAALMFNTAQSPLNRPIGLAVSPDGKKIYVSEEFNHRISTFDPQGVFQSTLGQQGSGDQAGALFNRPNDVAVVPNGNLVVADTWNYRIQEFSADGQYITRWGQPGEYGIDAPQQPQDAFWGPRAVAVDQQGHIYVADTGNKRIREYTSTGQYVRDIGSGGSGQGQLDEPTGLAIAPDGRLFVADTWNRRISVFMPDGTFSTSFPVKGWYEDLGNRPYIAIDSARSLLYIGDPDGGRVLVYDTSGNCVGSFGQLDREAPDLTQFNIVGGIAVDRDGNVYVADTGSGRVLKFAPFQVPAQSAMPSVEATSEVTSEITEQLGMNVPLNIEGTGELRPETTQEQQSTAEVLPQQTQEATPVG
jgi:predicted membrane-bound mannosyltransferase/DNA-binding beta-propeller fold protein YncE